MCTQHNTSHVPYEISYCVSEEVYNLQPNPRTNKYISKSSDVSQYKIHSYKTCEDYKHGFHTKHCNQYKCYR